jgi:hypothetical protein
VQAACERLVLSQLAVRTGSCLDDAGCRELLRSLKVELVNRYRTAACPAIVAWIVRYNRRRHSTLGFIHARSGDP